MTATDFLNAIKTEMGKTLQPWRFEGNFVYRQEPIDQSYYYAVGIETRHSHQQVTIVWSSLDGWDVVSLPECEPYAKWLRDRLQGRQRDEAGNMLPQQPLTLKPDEVLLLGETKS